MSKKQGSGQQQFVFDRADKPITVFVLFFKAMADHSIAPFHTLFIFGSIMPTSKRRRCFYWINRSFEVSREVSLLHLWYSQCQDPLSKSTIATICSAINEALPKPVKILKETLCRRISKTRYKTSWNLYPQVTFTHNAIGCMIDLVRNTVWQRLRHRENMVHGARSSPIIDFRIYSKNRLFRVPCSSKWEEGNKLQMPSRHFFMYTRMADRYGPPDVTKWSIRQNKWNYTEEIEQTLSRKRSSWTQRCVNEPESSVDGDTAAEWMWLGRPTIDKLSYV